jgi:hypothetical protein
VSFFTPELGDGALSRAADAKNRIAAAAAAPALFEAPAPAPAPTEAFELPAATAQQSAWSMPQVGRVAPRVVPPIEEIPANSASDGFEMPEKSN